MQSRLHALDRSLYRVDSEVRRSGRISRRDVDELLSEVQEIGAVTASQGLLLIRSCGSFLREAPPSERSKLAETVWGVLQQLGCPRDVSHYNALLQVYLENEQRFSPTDFLSSMEQGAGIEPNRVTYQRLIHAYCQEGDVAGASKILEYMKTKELPINEKVFNALVMGHARANDMDNAKNILEVMRNAQLEPTAETYCALLEGYAKRGDLEALQATLQEVERQGLSLLDHHYLDLVHVLACAGYSQHVPYVLGKIRRLAGYTQDCINSCLQLLALGHDDVAWQVFATMQLASGGHHGNFFAAQLVRCNMPLEKILFYCKQLQPNNPRALLRCTEVALQLKNTELAMRLIHELRNQGLPVRPHYFYPILLTKKAADDVYTVLESMVELGAPPNYDTLLDYVFPIVGTDDGRALLDGLKGVGLSGSAVVNPLLHHYLSRGDAARALDLVERHPANLVAPMLVPSVAHCFAETRDARMAAKILSYIEESPEATSAGSSKRPDWAGRFLLDCSNNPKLDSTVLSQLIPELAAHDVKVSAGTAEAIRTKHGRELSSSVLDMLDKISSEVLEDDASMSAAPIPSQNAMGIEDLEAHLVELKSKGMNTRGALRRLLLLHCRYRNLDRALEIQEQLSKEGTPFTGVMHAQLMDLFVAHGDLERALEHRKLIAQVEPSFRLDDHKILNLAALMVTKGQWQEARRLVEEHFERHGVVEAPDTLQRNVFRLLNAAATQQQQWPEGAQVTTALFDLVVTKCGYAPPSTLVLGPLVRVHLLRDDLPAALATFEQCCKQYKHTPLKRELSKQLIEKADSEGLQKVVDLSTQVHGEMNTLYDLATYFLECGQVRQAQKILETPGLRARHQRLDVICDTFLQKDMVTELEHLVRITRDLFDVDRDAMYFYLLKAYAKMGDVDRALEVWTKLQEENVQPSNRTLRFLGRLLQEHGHTTLPFAMPPEEEETGPVAERSTGSASSFRARIAQGLDEALEEKRKLEEQGERLTVGDLSQLIDALIQKERLKEASRLTEEMLQCGTHPYRGVLNLLVRRLASIGDAETLAALGSLLPAQLRRSHSVDNLVCNAYVNSGRTEEMLSQLEGDVVAWKERFPVGGILGLLLRQPEMEGRVRAMAGKYAAQEQSFLPANALWMHLMTAGRFEEADQILQEYPQLKERLLFASVLRESRRKQDEPTMRHLVKTVVQAEGMRPTAKSLAYGHLVELLVDKGQPEEALRTLEAAQAECGLQPHDWKHTTLVHLQTGLRSCGKDLPFPLPPQGQTPKTTGEEDGDSTDLEQLQR